MMKDERPQDATDQSHLELKDGDPKSVLTQLGKKAAPEERAALLKIGTDLIDALCF